MLPAWPFFSVIIATYNRPRELAGCLETLERLDYPKDRYEVAVVDDGGRAPLAPVVEPFRERLEVRLIRQENAGCGAARNAGAKRARGDYLAFTDDDCRHPPDWLKTLAARFASAPDAMVGGRTINVLADNPYSSASQLIIDYLFRHYNARPERARYLNSIALPAEGFRALGGFDASFFMAAEDRDFCERWLRAGREITYAPEVLVFHAHRLTLRSFCRQQFNYGRGAFLFHRRNSRRLPVGRGGQPLSFYLKLLGCAFRRDTARRAHVLAPLLLLSQAAVGCGWLREKYRPAGRAL
ncbi:MAG TPA: glycosyltransferase [Pyrinomonadaceae bacterium]|nr:glycosyltransferase [Pyrinomonadaceae bacterium]